VTELNTEQRIGAFLDAQGREREEIATSVGVTTTTVSRWRAQDEYKKEVDKWREHETALVERIVARVHAELAGAGAKSVERLVEALDATKTNGDPMWNVRLDAAKAILARIPPVQGEKDGSGARALAAVTLIVRRDGESFQVIEGEATEV